MTISSQRLFLLTIVATIVGGACSSPARPVPCVCTEEFRIFPVRIVDGAGEPALGVNLTRIHVPTGAVLEPGFLGLFQPGTYLVADDGMVDVFSDAGDTVRVTAEMNGASVTADFVFAVPEPCRCHVEQRAGPDTLVIGN